MGAFAVCAINLRQQGSFLRVRDRQGLWLQAKKKRERDEKKRIAQIGRLSPLEIFGEKNLPKIVGSSPMSTTIMALLEHVAAWSQQRWRRGLGLAARIF